MTIRSTDEGVVFENFAGVVEIDVVLEQIVRALSLAPAKAPDSRECLIEIFVHCSVLAPLQYGKRHAAMSIKNTPTLYIQTYISRVNGAALGPAL